MIVRGDRNRGLYVLTNNHVIEGAQPAKISIFLHDGRSLHPDRYWLDKKADIAVLNLARDDLPAARLGNSDEAAVGTWVLALGSPFGLTHSVSQGIISARGRHMDELQDVENQDFLQTDAAINPGNSGGPLVNMKGEVIGINNSIASNGGGNEGVGFSIPINLARWIMNQLLAQGRVSRGALGIDLHPEFRPEDAVSLGLERPRGAWVDRVHPGSPAASGGLHGGDVILRFNGVEIADLNHLINMVSMAPIGQPAEVVVWRGGKNDSFRVTVGERDRTIAAMRPPNGARAGGLLRRDDRPGAASSFALGLELVTLDAASCVAVGPARTTPGRPHSPGRSREPSGQRAQAARRDPHGRWPVDHDGRAGHPGLEPSHRPRSDRPGLRPREHPGHARTANDPGSMMARSPLITAIERLAGESNLTAAETSDAVTVIMAGEASEASIAAFLTALRVKGETADELAGAVEAVRAHMAPWDRDVEATTPRPLLDTCGTGGDGAGTVNVSTATALVVAACGVPVAKHGNRSASGNSGARRS